MKLLQKRNAAGSEFIYPGSVPKNECSIVLEICPTPNPSLNIPDSVNKCKLMQKRTTVPFYITYMQIWTALSNRDHTGLEPELHVS